MYNATFVYLHRRKFSTISLTSVVFLLSHCYSFRKILLVTVLFPYRFFFKKEFFLCQVFLILSIDVFHFSISFEKCNFFEHFLAANNFYIQVYLFNFFFSKIYHVSVYICILVVLFSVWRFNEDDSMF